MPPPPPPPFPLFAQNDERRGWGKEERGASFPLRAVQCAGSLFPCPVPIQAERRRRRRQRRSPFRPRDPPQYRRCAPLPVFRQGRGGGNATLPAARTHASLCPADPAGKHPHSPSPARPLPLAADGQQPRSAQRPETKREEGGELIQVPWCRTRRTPRRRRSWCSLPVSYPSFRVLASQQRHSPLAQRTPHTKKEIGGGGGGKESEEVEAGWTVEGEGGGSGARGGERRRRKCQRRRRRSTKRSGKRLQQILSSLHPCLSRIIDFSVHHASKATHRPHHSSASASAPLTKALPRPSCPSLARPPLRPGGSSRRPRRRPGPAPVPALLLRPRGRRRLRGLRAGQPRQEMDR